MVNGAGKLIACPCLSGLDAHLSHVLLDVDWQVFDLLLLTCERHVGRWTSSWIVAIATIRTRWALRLSLSLFNCRIVSTKEPLEVLGVLDRDV